MGAGSAPGLSFRGGREGQPAPPSPDLAKIYTVSAPTEARMGKRKKNKQSPKKFCTLNILLGCRQAILLGRGGTLGQSTGLDRLCTDFLCPPLQNSKGKPWSAPGLSFRGGREGQPAPPFTGLGQNLHRLCTDRGEDGKRKKNKQSPKKFCTLNILRGGRQAR